MVFFMIWPRGWIPQLPRTPIDPQESSAFIVNWCVCIYIPEKVGDKSQPPNNCSVAKSVR